MVAISSFGSHVAIAKVRINSPRDLVGKLFPDAGHGEGLVILHRDSIGLFPLARGVELLPFEIAVYWQRREA